MARLEVETAEGRRTLKEEQSPPLASIWSPGPHPHSRVGLNVGTQHNFGQVKIAAYVEYECDQTEAKVNEAGLLSFLKALEFVKDGMQLMLSEEKKT
jgi:hypothetical protein